MIMGLLAFLQNGLFRTVSSEHPLPVGTVGSDLPSITSATIVSAQTNATGANWTAFASQACTALDLVNVTGTAIEYRRDGAGLGMPIADLSARMVIGITNANQVEVRRIDQDNAQVTVFGEALA